MTAILSIDDVIVVEGSTGNEIARVTVRVSPAPTSPVTFDYITQATTAAAGDDFTAASGRVTLAAGQTSFTIMVNVVQDRQIERTEFVGIELQNLQGNAAFEGGRSTLTGYIRIITDDGGIGRQEVLVQRANGDLFAGSTGLLGGVNAIGSGDFNFDGRQDVVLKTGPDNYVWWDIGRGGAGFTDMLSLGSSQIAAIGNFVGGPEDDILLRDGTSSYRFYDVAATGSQPRTYDGLTLLGNFSFVGTGQLNASGRDEMVFRNNDTGAYLSWDTRTFTDLITLPLQSGWQLMGIGNYTGDARDDFLFFNTSTGTNLIWNISLGPLGFIDFPGPLPGVDVLGTGDVDGNGRDEALLRNNTTGTVVYWNGSSFVDVTTSVPQGTVIGIGDFL
ncbi:MAG TPA: Calx-beta domain-containing protein [Azospirillaceae bacterium]|nr:Calx-beta domain-containing protein [Azospirillaceae bacterium]